MSTIEGDGSTKNNRPAYIVSGYPADMKRFIEVNSGMTRRITETFNFQDYSNLELA